MRICTKCQSQSSDDTVICATCQADLNEWSTTAQALKRFQNNPRVLLVRIMVGQSCCPACRDAEGSFPKDKVPSLPVKGCSHPLGCHCFYQPILDEIYP